MVRTQVQLTEEQTRAFRQRVDTLTRSSGEIDAEERRRRAIAAAGRFRLGASDVSTEHDEYLEETFQG